jgi:hypothetical protein
VSPKVQAEATVNILDIEVPDTGPVFLVALAGHTLPALVAVVVGTLAALARKAPRGYPSSPGATFSRADDRPGDTT